MSFLNFFTGLTSIGLSLFNVKELLQCVFACIFSGLLQLVFSLVEFAYKIFEMAYSINLGTISGFLQGVINRVTALIIVIVIYNLAVTIFSLMNKTDDKEIKKQSGELLKNIFITAALLIGYNLVFGFMNELSLLMMGNKVGYDFPILSQVITIDKSADSGVLTRLIYGKEQKGKVGTILSCGLYSEFTDVGDCSDGFNFNSWDAAIEEVENGNTDLVRPYWPLGLIIGAGMAFYIFKAAIAIISRAFKLVLLQLAAPIPISSILLQGIKKGSTFANYCKSYIATFIELFTRVITMLVVFAVVVNFRNFVNGFIDPSNDPVSYSEPKIIALNDIDGYDNTNNELSNEVNNELTIPEVGEATTQDQTGGGSTAENETSQEATGAEENASKVDTVSRIVFFGVLGVGALMFANEAPKIIDSVFKTQSASKIGKIGSAIAGSGKGALGEAWKTKGGFGAKTIAALGGGMAGFTEGRGINKGHKIADKISNWGNKLGNNNQQKIQSGIESQIGTNESAIGEMNDAKSELESEGSQIDNDLTGLYNDRTQMDTREAALNNVESAQADYDRAQEAYDNLQGDVSQEEYSRISEELQNSKSNYDSAIKSYSDAGGSIGSNGRVDVSSERAAISTKKASIESDIKAKEERRKEINNTIPQIDKDIADKQKENDNLKNSKRYNASKERNKVK